MDRSTESVRAISAQERAVLVQALRLGGSPNVDPIPPEQLDSLQVLGICPCGCASVDFLETEPDQAAEVVAHAIGETPSGEPVDILVFAYNGVLTDMEIIGYSSTPAPLPVPATVRGWDGQRTSCAT